MRSRRATILFGLLLTTAATLLAPLLGPAAPAQAHAAVVASVPQPKAVLGASPTEVVVTFSEPVSLIPGRAQVLAPDGKRITAGEANVSGNVLRIPIRVADRPLGTYLVSYRVVSADSHPVAGSYTFSVGGPSSTPPRPSGDDVHRSVRIALPLAKYLGYAGLALLVGPTLLLGLLWPRRLPRHGPIRLTRLGLGLLALATLAGLWIQAPYRSGAPITDVTATELRQVLGTEFGVVMLARLAIIALVAVLLPPVLAGRAGRGRALALVLLGAAGLATWPLVGHAAAAPIPPAAITANLIHLAAMAVWLGGLITLVAFPLRTAHPRVLAVILPVWSRWASTAVVWLVAAGAVPAVMEIGAVGPLVDTAYGRLVLGKVALLAVVLAIAGYARRLIRRRTVPPRRLIGVEVTAIAVVLGLSAVLVQTTPARTATVEAAAAATEGFAETLEASYYTLQFDIYPVQLGENNTVHAYVYTPDGKPLPVVEWRMSAALPEQGIEPTTTPLLGLEPHHGVGAVTFPVPGQWQIKFTVRTSEIDQATVSTTVRVR